MPIVYPTNQLAGLLTTKPFGACMGFIRAFKWFSGVSVPVLFVRALYGRYGAPWFGFRFSGLYRFG